MAMTSFDLLKIPLLLPRPPPLTQEFNSIHRMLPGTRRTSSYWVGSVLPYLSLFVLRSCRVPPQLHCGRCFIAPSRLPPARLVDLQQQLQGITKGGSSCADYIHRLRSIADELAFIEALVSDPELVNYTLRGLGSDFNPLVLAINARSDPISLPDLHSLLLTCETRLNSQHASSQSPAASDHVAFYSNSRPRYLNPNPRTRYPFPSTGSRPNSFGPPPRPTTLGPRQPAFFLHISPRPNFNPRTPYWAPRPPAPVFSSTTPSATSSALFPHPCQICGRRNHQAIDCYHRFDNMYTIPTAPSSSHASAPPPPYQAFVAQPVTTTSAPHEWCIDSGATHHITSDFNNLSSFAACEGQDTLQIGNCLGMTIQYIGNSILYFSDFSLLLNDVLHIPNFTKILLSLSKLLHDNILLIEFSSSLCFIKDRQTKHLLLQAPLTNGLYILSTTPSLSQPQALLDVRVPANLWHA